MRKWLLVGGICGLDFALFTVVVNCQTLIGNLDDELAARYGFLKIACWLLATITILIIRKNGLQNDRLLSFGIPGLFVLCSFGLTIATIFKDQLNLKGFSDLFHNLAQIFQPGSIRPADLCRFDFIGSWRWFFFVRSGYSAQKLRLGIALAIFAAYPVIPF